MMRSTTARQFYRLSGISTNISGKMQRLPFGAGAVPSAGDVRGVSLPTTNNNTSAASSPLTTTQMRDKSYVLKFLRGHLPFDLKDVNGTIGALYGSLPDADEYGNFRLPDHLVQQYHQLGYMQLPHPVLDAQQCDKLADEVDQLANNVEHHPKTENLYATSLADLQDGPLFHCQGQWRATWGMHDLIYLPSLTVAASQCLGDQKIKLWYDEVMMKTSRKGPCIPWQQNYARWQHTKPVNHLTVMIALDTMNKDRGAPCLIPGSHQWREGELFPSIDYDPTKDESQQMNAIFDLVSEDEREIIMDMPPVTMDLQRGQAVFIHPMTLYATHGNRSLDNTRCVLLHYIGYPTFTVHHGALLPHTTKFLPDTPIDGVFYPTVFDPMLTEEPTLPGGAGAEPGEHLELEDGEVPPSEMPGYEQQQQHGGAHHDDGTLHVETVEAEPLDNNRQ